MVWEVVFIASIQDDSSTNKLPNCTIRLRPMTASFQQLREHCKVRDFLSGMCRGDALFGDVLHTSKQSRKLETDIERAAHFYFIRLKVKVTGHKQSLTRTSVQNPTQVCAGLKWSMQKKRNSWHTRQNSVQDLLLQACCSSSDKPMSFNLQWTVCLMKNNKLNTSPH